jgi:D-alanine-D-alanine ligase
MKAFPYTGCPLESIFITSNKQLATRILRLGGVPTSGSRSPDATADMHYGRKYIIKPKWEDGSMGITPESVFTYSPDDETRIKELHPNEWFIEDYIDGREFNISIYSGKDGPVILPPAEIEFRNYSGDKPRIVDFKAKWDTDSFEYINTVRVFPKDIYHSGLFDRLSRICIDSWNILGLKGYARIDIRCDSDSNPYVLEVNANPCISPDSGFIAACHEAGEDLTDVFRHIINDLN